MSTCGFEWMAPGLTLDYSKPLHRQIGTRVEKQICVLRPDHDGDHRSAANVTSAMKTRWRAAS